MPLYESPELTHEEMQKRAKRYACACGANLTVAWSAKDDCYILRCCENIDHQGFVRPHQIKNYQLPGYNMPGVIRRMEKEMMQKYGEEKTKAMVRVAGGNIIATLTQAGAAKMLTILYPDAAKNSSGQAAIIKGSLMCRDYGLNPAMDHIFLIKYQKWDKKHENVIDETWAVVTGIKAKRLICGREKSYGYMDDTPRIMTPDEQMKIYGEIDDESVVTITKLKDKDGNIFPGYGKWPKWKTYADGKKYPNQPMGVDKGNSQFNQSCVRGEGQALSKLNPGAMPADVDVVDERFVEHPTVTVTEVPPEPAKQIVEAPDIAGMSCDETTPDQDFEKLESAGTKPGTIAHKEKQDAETLISYPASEVIEKAKPITKEQKATLKKAVENGVDVGAMCVKAGWENIKSSGDLTEPQAARLIEDIFKLTPDKIVA